MSIPLTPAEQQEANRSGIQADDKTFFEIVEQFEVPCTLEDGPATCFIVNKCCGYAAAACDFHLEWNIRVTDRLLACDGATCAGCGAVYRAPLTALDTFRVVSL